MKRDKSWGISCTKRLFHLSHIDILWLALFYTLCLTFYGLLPPRLAYRIVLRKKHGTLKLTFFPCSNHCSERSRCFLANGLYLETNYWFFKGPQVSSPVA